MAAPSRPPPDVCIRRARTEEAAAIVELRTALRQEERSFGADLAETDETLLATTRRQIAARDQAFFVATLGEDMVGVLRCALPPAAGIVRHAVITTAYVVPQHRRRGVLRLLVDSAATWCRRRGVDDLRLRALAGNATANAAWDALGFAALSVIRRRSATR